MKSSDIIDDNDVMIRPWLFESLLIVCFYIIIQMRDAVINNYQLFYSYENLVQKHEKNGNAMFFS